MSKENIQLLWNISLERLLGILDLIALPVFAYASVQKARAERRQTRSMP